MKLLLDTQILLWATIEPERLSAAACNALLHESAQLYFSPVSIHEIGLKNALNRPDFQIDPRVFRRELLEHDYQEIPVTSAHLVRIYSLPPVHPDHFDRILLAQADVEGFTLVTALPVMETYGIPLIYGDRALFPDDDAARPARTS